MKHEHIDRTLTFHAGKGEWYNERAWGMFDDDHLPAARWHAEVDRAIESQESRPSRLVIDVTEITNLVIGDYGFLVGLSKRLRSTGIAVIVVARPGERRAYLAAGEALESHFEMVCTLDEALGRE